MFCLARFSSLKAKAQLRDEVTFTSSEVATFEEGLTYQSTMLPRMLILCCYTTWGERLASLALIIVIWFKHKRNDYLESITTNGLRAIWAFQIATGWSIAKLYTFCMKSNHRCQLLWIYAMQLYMLEFGSFRSSCCQAHFRKLYNYDISSLFAESHSISIYCECVHNKVCVFDFNCGDIWVPIRVNIDI